MAPIDQVNGDKSVALQFNGTPIRNQGQMLSLTDMWQASGAEQARKPYEWLRSADAQRFIDFLGEAVGIAEEGNSRFGLVRVSKGGSDRGATFAHWQIALAYAKYLSPEFHAACNVIIRQRMEGRHVSAALSADQDELLRRIDGISRMMAHKVTEIEKRVDERVDRMVEQRLLADPRVRALSLRPALDVLKDQGVPPRKRRQLSQRCSTRLLKFCNRNNFEYQESAETGRWLFHVNGIRAWLDAEGRVLIAEHVAMVRGQGVLSFPRAAK